MQSRHGPRVETVRIFLIIYQDGVVRRSAFETAALFPVHVGITTRINQKVLPIYNKVYMQLVKMSVAAAETAAPDMELIRSTSPV